MVRLVYYPVVSTHLKTLLNLRFNDGNFAFWSRKYIFGEDMRYRRIFVSIAHLLSHNIHSRRQVEADDCFIVVDSGGFELATGTLKPDEAARKWTTRFLPRMVKFGNAGFVLDWPLKNVENRSKIVSTVTYEEVVEKALYTAERWKEAVEWLRKRGERDFILIPILHGEEFSIISTWFKILVLAGANQADTWALSFPPRPPLSAVRYLVKQLLTVDIVEPRRIHILGLTGAMPLLGFAYAYLKYGLVRSVEEVWFDATTVWNASIFLEFVTRYFPKRHDFQIYESKQTGYNIHQMRVLPCSCPVCTLWNEKREELLKKVGKRVIPYILMLHNFYVMLRDVRELETIINSGSLQALEFWCEAHGAKDTFKKVKHVVDSEVQKFVDSESHAESGSGGILRWFK